MIESRAVQKTVVLISIGLFLGASALPAIGVSTAVQRSNDYHLIDINDAIRVAHSKLYELQKTGFSIASSTEKNRDEGEPLYFVFDLNPQGYLVVSGSYDLPPVIAYSFMNNFPDSSQSNPLSDMLTSDLVLRLQNIPNLSETMIQERHTDWDSYLADHPRSSGQFEQWPPEGSTPTGGWLLTHWDQSAPYNNLCPLDLAHGGGRSYAGCPAVAMAQILNYHNTTNDIVFNDTDDYYHNYAGNLYWIDNDHVMYDFPSFPQLNSYLTSLQNHYENHIQPTNTEKAALTFACGVAAHQVYSAGGSGTYGVSQAYQAYQRFNCSTVALLQANDPNLYGRLAHNMMDALPDHLAVVDPGWQYGHNLVIDGYNTDNYYHLNFGWGGSSDGWYLIPDEIPDGLTVIEGVIVDILQPNTGISDLSCNGTLTWVNVTPGNTATGSFTVQNTGDAGSDLAWKVTEWPTWGTWTFSPGYGHNLTPEDGPTTINVNVIAPNQQNQEYTGQIKIVNIDDSSDYQIIPVSLKTNSGIKADLSCSGSLTWTDVHPGSLMTGSFTVQNVGTSYSNLSWEVTSWPEWGNWTFTPSQGDHLTPEDGPLTINVSVIAPNKKHKVFNGQIQIMNSENSSDNGTIPVALTTPYKPNYPLMDLLQFLLDRFPHAFPILQYLFNW
jgi:hypothetical protein